MSTKLGTLTLDLIAKIGNFTGPIKEAEKQAAASFTKMREHVNTYGKTVATGAAVATTALAAMTVQYVNQAAEIQRFATISQTSTTDFQVMAVGAKQFGVEAEQLADIMKDFNEKIGEFTATGAGGAKDAFELLVKEQKMTSDEAMKLAQNISQVSGDQGLLMYVAALEKAGVSSDEMSFYLESVGSDLTKLAPLLENGGEGFRLWGDAAKKAGIIMDEYAIEKANILKVQMSLLTMQVQGARNQFMQSFIPAIIAVGGALTDTTEQTNLAADAGETLGNVFRGVAAVAIGVYSTVKLLSNAIAGLAVDAVNAKNLVDQAADKGGFLSKLPGVKLANTLIFGAATTKATNSGVKMAAADNAKVAEDSANAINKIFSDTVSAQTKALAALQQGQNKAGGNVKFGSTEFNDAMKDSGAAAAAAKAKADQAQAELERRLEESKRLGEQLVYEFVDDATKMKLDYQKTVADINKATFQSGYDKQDFLNAAKVRYDAELELRRINLAFEYSEHRLTEEEKLNFTLAKTRAEIKARSDINDEDKKSFYRAANEKHQHAMALLKISTEMEILETKRSYMNAAEYAKQYYALVREEIRKTPGMSTEKLNAGISRADQDEGIAQAEPKEKYESMMGGLYGGPSDLEIAREEFQERLTMLEDYYNSADMLDEEYQKRKTELMVHSGMEQASIIAGGLADMVDKSSGAYAVILGIQKSFAVYSALMAAKTAYAQAFADPSAMTVWQKIAGAATVAAAVMPAITELMSINTSITGMAHNGIDNVPKEGTWLLDGGERVLNPQQNKDLTNYLASGNSGNGDVTINNYSSSQVSTSKDDNGNLIVTIKETIDQYLPAQFGNPNSRLSKSVSGNFQAPRKR